MNRFFESGPGEPRASDKGFMGQAPSLTEPGWRCCLYRRQRAACAGHQRRSGHRAPELPADEARLSCKGEEEVLLLRMGGIGDSPGHSPALPAQH